MNRQTISATLIVTLCAGALLGYWLGGKRAAHTTGATPATRLAPDREPGRRILYWHDPMMPGVKFDKPGKSPYMDMPLVPVYADEEPAGATVRIDPAVSQNLGVRIGKAEMTTLEPRLAAVGSVAFDERLLAVVQARVEGSIARLWVKAPLERVSRGQRLADILAPQWIAAEEEYVALLDAGTERTRAIRDAARQRLTVIGVPESEIRKIERQRAAEPTTAIYAPVDGVVTGLGAREGTAFASGAELFRINGLATVWVNAQVPESQVSMIPRGSTVEASAAGWPGTTFAGRVAELLPEVDPVTRTIPVRIVVDNADRRLAPGMFLALEFAGQPARPRLTVPSEAVIVTGERSVVIVAGKRGEFSVAEVVAGAESGDRTEILSGLAEGQPVVLSGQFLIDSEASLRSALTRLESGKPAPEPRP